MEDWLKGPEYIHLIWFLRKLIRKLRFKKVISGIEKWYNYIEEVAQRDRRGGIKINLHLVALEQNHETQKKKILKSILKKTYFKKRKKERNEKDWQQKQRPEENGIFSKW